MITTHIETLRYRRADDPVSTLATPSAPGLKDQYSRNINYLRISLTDVCNLRCVYCMPESMTFKPEPEMLQLDEFEALIKIFAKLGFNMFRYTGGEPTLFKALPTLIKNVQDAAPDAFQALTTNGITLAHLATPLRDAGVQRVNISIDTLHPGRYRDITRWGRLQDALNGLEAAERAGLQVKINAVIVRGWNDQEDVIELAKLSQHKPWQIRFIELMPFGGGIHSFQQDRIVSEQELRDRISAALGPLELQNNGTLDGEARVFALHGAKGSLGFISSVTAPFCASCNRARLTADGKLRLCLLRPDEIDLRTPLRQGQSVTDMNSHIRKAIFRKPWGHGLDQDEFATDRAMSEIGG